MASSFLDPRARAQALTQVATARSALSAAEARRDRAQADALRAAAALARIAPLAPQGIVSRQSLDNAQADADSSRGAVRAAEADIGGRRADLASAQFALTGPLATGPEVIAITAPASGVVTRLLQQSERSVAAGTTLAEVGATSGLEAQIEFLSQDAVKIRRGQRAELYNWGGAGLIPAVVRRVEPQGFTKVSALGVEERRTLVMLLFTGPASGWTGLAPGYRVWGRVFLRETPSAVVAPLGALVRDSGGWAVFRIERGRARLRPVRVGALTDHDAEILSGAAPGELLVDYPSDQVRDGARVRSMPSN
jgi:HlyD family secretion protein